MADISQQENILIEVEVKHGAGSGDAYLDITEENAARIRRAYVRKNTEIKLHTKVSEGGASVELIATPLIFTTEEQEGIKRLVVTMVAGNEFLDVDCGVITPEDYKD